MKKILLLLILLSVITMSFSGCNGSIGDLELKNRLIIQGVGIDKGENGELSISVQALNTDISSNPSSGDSPSEIVKYFTVTGPSVSQALDVLSEKTGKDPLLSQNRIVVFGKDFAKEGIAAYLDDFIRSSENRETVIVAIADEKAEDIIFADLGEGIIPARHVEQIMMSSSSNIDIIDTQVYELINHIKGDGSAGFMPVLKTEKEEDKDVVSVISTAVFLEDKYDSEVDRDITEGIEWVIDEVKKGKFSFTYNDEYNVTVNIIKSDTKVSVKIKDGKPHYTVKVKAFVDCSEINDSIFNKKNSETIDSITKECEKEIKNRIEKSIDECIIKNGYDVFGFGKRLMRSEKEYYRQNITDWGSQMRDITFDAQVNVKMKQIGDSVADLNSGEKK